MYCTNIKKLRLLHEKKQSDVALSLGCLRARYSMWESGLVMIPLEFADKLALLYNVKLAYILGIEKSMSSNQYNVPMDYNVVLERLNSLKEENHNSYEEIALYLNCNRSTCYRYFKGIIKLPVDRLILICRLYEVDVDWLCGKKNEIVSTKTNTNNRI